MEIENTEQNEHSSLQIQKFNFWGYSRLEETLRADHLMYVDAVFKRQLMRPAIKALPSAKILNEKLAGLSRHSYQRIISAPQFFYVTKFFEADHSQQFIDQILSWVIAEEYMASSAKKPVDLVWTAMGDRCFDSEEIDLPGYRNGIAKKVDGTITLDLGSPWWWTGSAAKAMEFEGSRKLTEEEASELNNILNRSFGYIRSVDTSVANFVSNHISVIQAKYFGKSIRELGSSSWAFTPGVIILGLSELENWFIESFVDALVHESIHNFQFLVGRSVPPVRDYFSLEKVLIKSPWTGSPLSAYAMIHATIVWHQLYSFWKAAKAKGIGDSERVDEKISRSLNGFLQDFDIGAELAKLVPSIDQIYVDICRNIQIEVRDSVGL